MRRRLVPDQRPWGQIPRPLQGTVKSGPPPTRRSAGTCRSIHSWSSTGTDSRLGWATLLEMLAAAENFVAHSAARGPEWSTSLQGLRQDKSKSDGN